MSARDLLDLVWIVPLLPLAGAALLLLAGRRIGEPTAGWIASGLMALAFAWSVVMFFALHSLPTEARSHVTSLYTWLPAGGLQVKLGLLADPLSVTFILFVTGVGTLIHVFAVGYMHGDARFSRFFGYMNLFCFSMLMLVLGSNFLVTFLGWEGVGLCSYLLISFWFERHNAAIAGKKAFVTTRIGDVGFMIAIFFIFEKLGSLDYSVMGEHASGLSNATATAIALLLFLGAIGKSAQLPLHVWLPDAMEGPTPVSALIHAATMVTAGVFLIARAHPFFEASSSASAVVAWVGVVTALLAATVGLVQPDIKRVLAYSTISQLGFMFLALGVGAYGAAIFHVVTHAFFKATLFLGAGSVIHGNADNQDMRIMGGFRKYLPYTAFASIVAWLAIAGVPPLAGFWSKDEILTETFLAHHEHPWAWGAWVLGLVAAGLTGFYMTRQVWLVFFGNERFQDVPEATPLPVVSGGSDDAHAVAVLDDDPEWDPHEPTVPYGTPPRTPVLHGHAPHEAPPAMTIPVLVLAGLAVVGGLLSIPLRGLGALVGWLEPVFHDAPEVAAPSFWGGVGLTAMSFVAGAIGIVLGLKAYRRGLPAPDRDPPAERLGRLRDIFGFAYFFDGAVTRFVGGPVRRTAAWLSGTVDARGIDGIVNGLAALVNGASHSLRRAQNGLVRVYAVGVLLGAAGLLLYFLVWGAVAVSDFPILSALIVTPFIGTLLILVTPAHRPEIVRAVGYGVSAATLGLAGWLVYHFETGHAGYQFVEQHQWIDALGVKYVVGVDGISLFMVVLTALLFPIGLLASANITERPKAFFAWMLLLEASLVGVFLSLDLVLFFVFFEFVLVPMYFIILGWGYERRQYASVKFFLFTMAGSAFLLVGLLTLAFLHQSDTGILTFDLRTLTAWAPGGLDSGTAKWLFLAFFAAFAVKVPLFPLHTWLPDAHTEAPTAGSVILAGVLLKMGTYGFLRFSLALFPQASVDLAPLLLVLAVIGIIYGAVVAAMQPDLKRLIAYSSVAHLGFVVLGTFALTTQGLDGAVFTMISHGLTTGALFLLVGMLYERRHTREIAQFGGLWRTVPVIGGLFCAAAFASIGLPGFSGFIGEFLSLLGTFLTQRPYAIVASVGVVLAAVYLLWAFQRVFTGRPRGENAKLPDISPRELACVAPLLALSLFLGIYPKPVLDRIEPQVRDLVCHVDRHSDYHLPATGLAAERCPK